MGTFDDILGEIEAKKETRQKPRGNAFSDILGEIEAKQKPPVAQEQPKRSFLGNVFHGLQQLQRPQSAIATPFVENIETAKADYARREAGGEQDFLLPAKMAANIPGAMWRGLTAKTEKQKDFTDVVRSAGVDPYQNITDAWQDVKSGTGSIPGAVGKMLLNIPILGGEVGANLVADPLNWVGIGGVTKLGKAAQMNKAAQAAGEAITATSKIGKELETAKQAGRATLPAGTAREQALLGQKAALTFAGQPILPNKVSAAILGGVEDISAKAAGNPYIQGLTDAFNTTKNQELKLALSKLRAGLQNVVAEGKREAIGIRENLRAMSRVTGTPVDELSKQLGARVESLPGSKKGTLPVEVMADEYKATKAAQFEARGLAGVSPAKLGGGLDSQLAELKADYATRLGQRGANIIKFADKRMSAIERRMAGLEGAIKDEVLRVGSGTRGSLGVPIGRIDRQIAALESRIKTAEHDLGSAMQLVGVPKADAAGRAIVDLRDMSRAAGISKEIEGLRKKVIQLSNSKAQLEGVQSLIKEPAQSNKLDGLIKARKTAHMDYFNEIGTMNKLLDKGDPAVIRKLEPKIAALEANLAANPTYAVHALTPEAMELLAFRKGTSIRVGGDVVSLDNPSDIARTFTLEPQVAEKLRGLGVKDLNGVGKTTNEMRLAARLKPLPFGNKVAIPGRSLTRKEVNSLAEAGQLPGYEGVRFSQTKPSDLQKGEEWIKNEFFYSDPLVGRAIETMRTNKQLVFKKFMDDVAEKFGDPNGEDFRGIKVRPEIARDLNKYVITLEKPQNKLFDSISKGVEQGTDIWKILATSANPGFHIRNFLSGVWANMALGNVHTATPYRAAQGILRPNAQNNKFVDSILAKVKAQTGREYTFDSLVAEAKSRGLIGSGAFGADIKDIAPAIGKDPNAIQKLGQLANMAGRYVESTNRLALWLDQLTKGATLDQATQTVHRLQFDYGDLTRFEQGVKKAIPFYAWLRKNIALQVEEMLQRPGRYNSYSGKLLREIEKSSGEVSEEEKRLRPEYFGQFGFTRLPWKGSKGSPLYINPNLPFQDLRQLDPSAAWQNLLGALDPALSTALQLAFNKDFRNRDLANYTSSDQQFPFQGAHVPARGAGNALYPFYGQGPVFAHPDRRETKVPPQLQFLLNRIPLAANLGELLFSKKANPDEETIPFLGDIDTGILSGLGGIKITPLDIEQARAIQKLKANADMQAKRMQQKREGRE